MCRSHTRYEEYFTSVGNLAVAPEALARNSPRVNIYPPGRVTFFVMGLYTVTIRVCSTGALRIHFCLGFNAHVHSVRTARTCEETLLNGTEWKGQLTGVK
jgi:hypothetical protein